MNTLGEIVDKICIVKLKNYYADTDAKKTSTHEQLSLLCNELDRYMSGVLNGTETVKFDQNKVYKKFMTIVGDPTPELTLGELVLKLMKANHLMWLHQDELYNIDMIPDDKIRPLIKASAALNIERNQFIDAINNKLAMSLTKGDRT